MERGATFSADAVYRYTLGRCWGPGPRVLWVMLNPSTADAERDDPTIRRCIGFSRGWGFGALEVVNLFALPATEPALVAAHAAPIGEENDRWLMAAAAGADEVIAAWGAFEWAAPRAAAVMRLLAGRRIRCLGRTARGWPRHPLYAPRGARRSAYAGMRPSRESAAVPL